MKGIEHYLVLNVYTDTLIFFAFRSLLCNKPVSSGLMEESTRKQVASLLFFYSYIVCLPLTFQASAPSIYFQKCIAIIPLCAKSFRKGWYFNIYPFLHRSLLLHHGVRHHGLRILLLRHHILLLHGHRTLLPHSWVSLR